ncbi:MAG TPA: polysaccharide biosynthesis/export family protein [Salinimicrobium sp.]|nr:polysaccharide biosynthesis/export family protein [Salinimicrobium sp.]
MKKFIVLTFIALFVSSCATREEIVFFQNIEKIEDFEDLEQFEPKIEVNDLLRIHVSSINDEVVEPFNVSFNNQLNGGGGNNMNMLGYLVDAEGNITFPVLGEVEVINKTTSELEEYLTGILREKYVTDAVVKVRLVNFKITVLGEVGSQGVIQVPDEQVTIPEIIALAGGITYNGLRENILVIRNNEGELTYGRVDLTDASVFEDPYFYLKQNDIVYVEPTYRRVKSAGFFSSPGSILSIISATLSLIFIFTR